MKVKICGLTRSEEAKILVDENAEFAGMVLFCPKSKRNITLEQAKDILEALGSDIKKTAVLLSPSLEEIKKVQTLPFDYLQIHGTITEELIDELEKPFLRAFNVKNMDELPRYQQEEKCVGYVFDAAEPGSGKSFDWNLLNKIERDDKIFVLAGGLTPENVADAIKAVSPDVVDVSSGVEYTDRPGKNPEKVRAFIHAARESEDYDERI